MAPTPVSNWNQTFLRAAGVELTGKTGAFFDHTDATVWKKYQPASEAARGHVKLTVKQANWHKECVLELEKSSKATDLAVGAGNVDQAFVRFGAKTAVPDKSQAYSVLRVAGKGGSISQYANKANKDTFADYKVDSDLIAWKKEDLEAQFLGLYKRREQTNGELVIRLLDSISDIKVRAYCHKLVLLADAAHRKGSSGEKAYNALIKANPAGAVEKFENRPHPKSFAFLADDEQRTVAFFEARVRNGRGFEVLSYINTEAASPEVESAESTDTATPDFTFGVYTPSHADRAFFVKDLLVFYDDIVLKAKPKSHQEPSTQTWDHLHSVVGAAGPLTEDGLVQRGHWMALGLSFNKGALNTFSNKHYWLTNQDPAYGTKSAWIPTGKGSVSEVWFSDATDPKVEEDRAAAEDRLPYALWNTLDVEDRYVVFPGKDDPAQTTEDGVVQEKPVRSVHAAPPLSVIDKDGKTKKSLAWDGKYVPTLVPGGVMNPKKRNELNPTLPPIDTKASSSSSSSSSSGYSTNPYSSYGSYGGYGGYGSYGSYGGYGQY